MVGWQYVTGTLIAILVDREEEEEDNRGQRFGARASWTLFSKH